MTDSFSRQARKNKFISKIMSGNKTSTKVALALTAVTVIGVSVWGYFMTQEKKNEKYDVVFVLGGPGSGKGTNCTKIVAQFGYTHLSAGDLLREERNSGSKLATMINNYIAEGKIVPAEVTVGLLLKAMDAAPTKKFLVDGFPRNMENLQCWTDKVSQFVNVKFLLFLECTEAIMLDRLLDRGKTSGRNDDNVDSIKKRFATYRESTMPIVEHFRSQGKVREVDSTRAPDAVYADVCKLF